MYLKTTNRVAVFVAIALLLAGSTGLAQSGDDYDLGWWTVDGGGTALRANGGYELGGAIGQPDAGPVLKNGDYALAGGFWQMGRAAGPGMYPLYLPLILHNAP